MDPQQTPGNPVESNAESEHREPSIGSSEQVAPVSQGAQRAPRLPAEMARSPSQGAPLSESPRELPAVAPPVRPISDLPQAYYDRPGFEGAPSNRYWEGPYDTRAGRYPTLLPPGSNGKQRTADSTRRPMPVWDYSQAEQHNLPAPPRQTVRMRLHPLIEQAVAQRHKLSRWADVAKWTLSLVSFIQVFLGAMTTGASAIRLSGERLGIATTVLGILTTLAGAIVAKVRADGEPEQSLLRGRDLDLFIRRCEDLVTDHGDEDGRQFDDKIKELRHDYEQMMQNSQNKYTTSPLTKDKDKEKPGAQAEAGAKA